MLSIIVAMDEAGLIGCPEGLPWHLSNDLKLFKSRTLNHTIIMGRLTHLAIGKALPGRRNIILSRQKNFSIASCEVLSSVDQVLKTIPENKENFVIGGAKVYRAFLPFTNKLYLTRVPGCYQGDTYFPKLDLSKWSLTETEIYPDFKVEIFCKQ